MWALIYQTCRKEFSVEIDEQKGMWQLQQVD